jgi:hypothetical protein
MHICKYIVPAVGLLLFVALPAAGQEGDGFWPATVKIDPVKKEVFPDEEVTITLTDFRDADGSQPKPEFLIHVAPESGRIANGDGCRLLVGKVFSVGAGTVNVTYYPPSNPKIEEDRINIYSLYTTDYWDKESLDIPTEGKIGEVEITIRRFDYARIIYHDYSLSWDDGGSKYLSDIEVSVGVGYRPIGGRRYVADLVNVLTCKGTETQQVSGEKEYKSRLVSAAVQSYSSLVVFHTDDKGEVEAVSLPVVVLGLTWAGDSDNPPADLVIGPVSEYNDQEAVDDTLDKLKSVKPESGQKESATLPAAARLLYHPDFRVLMRGKNYFAGNGKWQDSDEHDIYKKNYIWEVNTKDQ